MNFLEDSVRLNTWSFRKSSSCTLASFALESVGVSGREIQKTKFRVVKIDSNDITVVNLRVLLHYIIKISLEAIGRTNIVITLPVGFSMTFFSLNRYINSTTVVNIDNNVAL